MFYYFLYTFLFLGETISLSDARNPIPTVISFLYVGKNKITNSETFERKNKIS